MIEGHTIPVIITLLGSNEHVTNLRVMGFQHKVEAYRCLDARTKTHKAMYLPEYKEKSGHFIFTSNNRKELS